MDFAICDSLPDFCRTIKCELDTFDISVRNRIQFFAVRNDLLGSCLHAQKFRELLLNCLNRKKNENVAF